MRDLEDATKPILVPLIDDRHSKLDILQQSAIARWATKTAMVFEYVTNERDMYYTEDERRSLGHSTSLYLPSRTYVWLGRYVGRFHLLTYGADASGTNPKLPVVKA
jgi:hypothetical protein